MYRFGVILSLLAHPQLLALEFSATWQQEFSYNSALGHTQKNQSILDLEWQGDVSDNLYLTTLVRYKSDSHNNISTRTKAHDSYFAASKPHYFDKRQQLELREAYLDFYLGDAAWRIGKQQQVWGQADGLKVLDQINPQNFDEFILDRFEDSRIPLWMAAVEFPWFDGQLQLLWIPDSSVHQLAEAESSYAISASAQRPNFGPALGFDGIETLDNKFSNSDVGVRWSAFLQGWDITLNYLYHYLDFADFKLSNNNLSAYYQRSHLIGGTLSNAMGDFTLRAEVGLQSHQGFVTESGVSLQKRELASVLGLDWRGLSDTLLSGQIFTSYIHDYDNTIIRDQTQLRASFLWQQNFANETWQWRMLSIFSINQGDRLIRPRLRYRWQENLDIWLSADIFSGKSDSLFGQFAQRDSISLGFEWGFN